MVELLRFLIKYCAPILNKPGFRFVDSCVGQHPAMGSWILLESNEMQIYVCNESEKITFEVRSVFDKNDKNWFSFDLISEFLGRPVSSGVMSAESSTFLSQRIEVLLDAFSKGSFISTIDSLNSLKSKRTRSL